MVALRGIADISALPMLPQDIQVRSWRSGFRRLTKIETRLEQHSIFRRGSAGEVQIRGHEGGRRLRTFFLEEGSERQKGSC